MNMKLARRAAMKALLGAPIAAQGIVQAAAKEALGHVVDNRPNMSTGQAGLDCEGPMESNPLFDLFHKHQRDQMQRLSRQRGREIEHHMPVSVSSKKSWSPAFKAHVTGQFIREYESWDDYSDEARIRALVRIGVLPKSLLGVDQ